MNLAPMVKCDNRTCKKTTKDPVLDAWIFSSGETMQGGHILHDHRAAAGHYCSWHCFSGQPVLDL